MASTGLRSEHNVGRRDYMLGAVLPSASGDEAASPVSFVVESDDRDGFANDERVTWNRDAVLERLKKGPELLVVPIGVGRDLLDQWIQTGGGLTVIAFGLFHFRLLSRSFQRVLAASRKDGSALGPEPATRRSNPGMKPRLR